MSVDKKAIFMYLMTQQFCTRQNEDPTTRAICVETRSHTHMPEMVDIKHAERWATKARRI